MNLLLRSRADIRDTPEQAADDVRSGDGWTQKALAAKMGAIAPNAIRISGNVSAANLITKVEPVYPPLALQARIQGTVKFNAVIGKDGHINNLTLVSGHPLLVTASQTAVQQWVYKPTLLNGQPTEVITTLDVNFALPQ
jgi:outer membrane biosynthesis protein TonB